MLHTSLNTNTNSCALSGRIICRFVLGHPLVASAVIGASCLPQLDELLAAARQPQLPAEILDRIDAIHLAYPSPTP
jgi:aryl-alcohol dehydrogenase-like predicted oxidoreductase